MEYPSGTRTDGRNTGDDVDGRKPLGKQPAAEDPVW